MSLNNHNPEQSVFLIGLVRCVSFVIGKILFWVEFAGKENIPGDLDSGFIVASNHQSYFDPFLIGIPIKQKMFFMAWDKAFDWILVGWLIRKLGAFPVSIDPGIKSGATRTALDLVKGGNVLFVFPEASREFSDGKLLTFKGGAARLALKSGVPVLPVTVKGANKVWPRDQRLPKPGKITIHYHPLLHLNEKENETQADAVRAATGRLEDIISSV